MKTGLFQSCGHCWVFQICWHIECSTFTASSFRIWNSPTEMGKVKKGKDKEGKRTRTKPWKTLFGGLMDEEELASGIQGAASRGRKKSLRMVSWDFPSGPVVKNLPCNTGDTGLILVWEDHTCLGAAKPCVPLSPCSTREATAVRSPPTASKSSPHLLYLEKAHAQQQRPCAGKNT